MTPKALSHVWLSAGKTEAKLYPGERGVRKVAEASQNWFYRTIYEKKDGRELAWWLAAVTLAAENLFPPLGALKGKARHERKHNMGRG